MFLEARGVHFLAARETSISDLEDGRNLTGGLEGVGHIVSVIAEGYDWSNENDPFMAHLRG